MTTDALKDSSALPPAVIAAAGRTDVAGIPGVLGCMRQIQEGLTGSPESHEVGGLADLHGMTDGLACFNHLYRVITAQILEELSSGLAFVTQDFLEELDVQFARRYFDAITSYGAGACSSRAWQVLIERRGDPAITPMQFAVAGVNTHVNFDLPFAVVATCRKLGTALEAEGQRHDYDRVNEVFFEKIPQLRTLFEERWQRYLDRGIFRMIFNQLDNMIVVLDRALAWEQAEHLWGIRNSGAFPRAERTLDGAVALVNHSLLTALTPWI